MAHGLNDRAKWLMRNFVDKLAVGMEFSVVDMLDYVNAHNKQVNISNQSIVKWCGCQGDIMQVCRGRWQKIEGCR